jgi:hypothetical protein
MQILLLFVMFSFAFETSRASFAQDTSFINYKDLSGLSRKEVKRQFYQDVDRGKMTDSYNRHRNKGWGLLFWIVPLVAVGTFFAVTASHATNGMAGTINVVLAVAFLLPALLLTIKLITRLISKKHSYYKKPL